MKLYLSILFTALAAAATAEELHNEISRTLREDPLNSNLRGGWPHVSTSTYIPTLSPVHDRPPTVSTKIPTLSPTLIPTFIPTPPPTETPTDSPIVTPPPTETPTDSPFSTPAPTESPSDSPVITPPPTGAPTDSPVVTPNPTYNPTGAPSARLKKTGKSCNSGSECRSTCCGDAGDGNGKVCYKLGPSNSYICPYP